MSYLCEICGSSLSSLQILKTHKKTAKKCLKLQIVLQNTISRIEPIIPSRSKVEPQTKPLKIHCQLCSTIVNKYKYKKHLSICKKFDESKYDYKRGMIIEKNSGSPLEMRFCLDLLTENKLLKETIIDQQEIIGKTREKSLEEKIKALENALIEKNKELDRRTKLLEKKAFEPKNVNYGIVQQYLSKPIDLEGIKYKEIVNEKLKLSHVKEGEAGMANFVLDEVVRDKETKEIYIVCCDEKKTLKYVKTDGVMVTDKGGKFFLQTMKNKLIPFVNTRITDLVDALPEEEKEEHLKLYGSLVVLGYAFSEHIAARTYINRDDGINPFRDQSEIKMITDAEAKFATKKMKNDRKDRRELVKMEKKDAEENTDEMKMMREQDRKIDEAREERKQKKNEEKEEKKQEREAKKREKEEKKKLKTNID